MNGRRAIVGLCLLCAMAFSAIAAQSAMAAKGTTMFTCTSSAPTKTFGTADCNTAGSGFGHVEVAQDLTTHAKYVAAGPQIFKSTIAGTAFTLSTSELIGTGSCFNRLNGKEHWIQCLEVILHYTNVVVNLPAGCGVKSVPGEVAGTIQTNALKATTQTEQMAVKLEPEAGTTLAEWEWTGAPTCPFSGKAKVVGSITCVPSGAELVCNHAEVTASKTLRFGSAAGNPAGYEGRATITGGKEKPEKGEPTNPLSSTTVETA